ncbi:MAG: transcriptional regulator, LytR/AlgR family [Acidobacteriales bacterium]|nr:transcriptional regulator, LytR/AlgR family [Terriglobales bacterium]
MGIKALIIDDEPLARQRIHALLSSDPEIEIIGECGDGNTALGLIQENEPDLLFLDVQMPNIDGFDVLASIKSKIPAIIFVTAFDMHAVRAFESAAIDFVLKPFSRTRFFGAIARAKNHLTTKSQRLSNEGGTGTEGRVVFRSNGKIMVFGIDNIEWIEARANYVRVQTLGAQYEVRESISSFEKKLLHPKFIRVHRSFIVNLDRVSMLEPCNGSEYIVTLISGKKVPLGRTYRSTMRRALGLDKYDPMH